MLTTWKLFLLRPAPLAASLPPVAVTCAQESGDSIDIPAHRMPRPVLDRVGRLIARVVVKISRSWFRRSSPKDLIDQLRSPELQSGLVAHD